MAAHPFRDLYPLATICQLRRHLRRRRFRGLPRPREGHVRADLIARYNKDDTWSGRSDAFAHVSDCVATLIGARTGAAVIPLRG